jgi:hypothetical protein
MASKENVLIITATILAFLIIACQKHCIPMTYALTGGISTFNPDKDSIRVGDTLWFSTSFPVKLKYVASSSSDSEMVDLNGATNVGTDIHIIAFPKKNLYTGALDSFLILPLIGTVAVNPLAADAAETINLQEVQNNFVSAFALVAQKKGVYCIQIIDIYQAMKNCTKASVTLPIGNLVNQHLNYLDSVYFPGSRYEPSISSFDLTHDYCFTVY